VALLARHVERGLLSGAGEGRTALVTGAGGGIGRATALALLEAGWRVALAGRRAETLQAAAEAAGAGRRRALVAPADVSDEAEVKALFATVAERFGRLDLLFNNAGIAAPKAEFDALTLDQWNAVMAVNLTGAFLCAREAFALMKAQNPRGGRIINNGSLAAHALRPQSAPYTVSKHAITGLTRQLSLDGRAFDIACGQIDIGNAVTDMTGATAQGTPQADGSVRPEPRMDVRHVAEAVVHMAGLPLEANVQFLTVMATKMPFVGRG
jgi:NAD(P)-dependent dehydrogenase (short-subunit alcohol dehydrogenase family)